MAAGSHVRFDLSNNKPPTKCIVGVSLFLKIRVYRIYSLGELLYFCLAFGLKLPIYAHFWAGLEAYSPK